MIGGVSSESSLIGECVRIQLDVVFFGVFSGTHFTHVEKRKQTKDGVKEKNEFLYNGYQHVPQATALNYYKLYECSLL